MVHVRSINGWEATAEQEGWEVWMKWTLDCKRDELICADDGEREKAG